VCAAGNNAKLVINPGRLGVRRSIVFFCVTCINVKLLLRDERTDARNRIWCISTLDVTSGGNNFNNFYNYKLIKFRVFIG